MCNNELDPVDVFFHQVTEFVESYTKFDTYKAMDEEKKEKYITKLVLLICFENSPRKHFGISMETIRLIVRDVLEAKAAESHDEE